MAYQNYPSYPNYGPYGPYGTNPLNAQDYDNLINKMEEQTKQMRQFQQQRNQYQMQQPQAITQNFQLAPAQSMSDLDGKYANNFEEVKNTLALKNTLFVNKDMNTLWLKNTSGDIKTYSLTEIIELDPKDKEIAELKQQVAILQEGLQMKNQNEPSANMSQPKEQRDMNYNNRPDKKKNNNREG